LKTVYDVMARQWRAIVWVTRRPGGDAPLEWEGEYQVEADPTWAGLDVPFSPHLCPPYEARVVALLPVSWAVAVWEVGRDGLALGGWLDGQSRPSYEEAASSSPHPLTRFARGDQRAPRVGGNCWPPGLAERQALQGRALDLARQR
jgi:hypothetical protein